MLSYICYASQKDKEARDFPHLHSPPKFLSSLLLPLIPVPNPYISIMLIKKKNIPLLPESYKGADENVGQLAKPSNV